MTIVIYRMHDEKGKNQMRKYIQGSEEKVRSYKRKKHLRNK
jgi:hypothetical protein